MKLLEMDDIQAPPIGTEGTVVHVDDTGSICVRWDTGSGLNVNIKRKEREKNMEDWTYVC